MPHHEQYILKVTAGATYDTSKHEDVQVNTEKPINISSEHLDARITVRVKDYRGTSHLRTARDSIQRSPAMRAGPTKSTNTSRLYISMLTQRHRSS